MMKHTLFRLPRCTLVMLLAVCSAGLLCAQEPPGDLRQGEEAASAETQAPSTEPAAPAKGNGIVLNFRQAPLDAVLDHLSRSAGFVVVKEADTAGPVDVWSHQPLTREEAVDLLNTVLAARGLAAVQTDRTLRVVKQGEAAVYDLPVHSGGNPESIPRGDVMITQIIPVRYADAARMLDNLKPLLASYALISANQSSNAILVTDTQTRVRRIASVIQALDTSISSVTEIRVFPLQNADAEELATLITEVFESPSEERQTRSDPRDRMRQFFMRMRGRGGDEGPGAGGEPGSDNDGRVASTTVKAVADAHSNAVVVNAPNDLMDDIEALIRQIDVAAEELLQFRVFPCRYADAESVAESITTLFKTESSARNSSNGSRRFSRFGMTRGGPPGAQQSGSTSERKLEEAEVRAAADLRTNSVMVTASAKTMAMVEQMVRELDASPRNVPQVYVYRVQHADLEALQETLQNMFDDIEDNSSGSSSTTRSTTAPTASTRTGTRSASTGTRSTGTSSGTRR